MKNFLLITLLFAVTSTVLADKGTESGLIPAIQSAPKNSGLPTHIFEQYSVKSIAENLVYKLRKTANPQQDDSDQLKAEIQVLFPLQVLDSIKNHGFLNRPIRLGGLSSAVDLMMAVEDLIIQHKLPTIFVQNKEHLKIRPIYGYLSSPDIKHDDVNLSYGNVVAVLKKNTHSRATFTVGDSMNLYANTRKRPEVHTFSLPKDAELPLLPGGNSYYYEVQVWGGVDFEDIKYFLVLPYVNHEEVSELKKAGLPVFQAELEFNTGKVIRIHKGQAL